MHCREHSSPSLGIAAAFAVAAAELPDRIKKAGKIVIATQPNYPPIAYKDPATNQLTGFDIDLGEAIAKELGVKVEWQETAFAQMISSLQTGRVDIAMAGMSDLPARREVVDFVDYMKTGPAVLHDDGPRRRAEDHRGPVRQEGRREPQHQLARSDGGAEQEPLHAARAARRWS